MARLPAVACLMAVAWLSASTLRSLPGAAFAQGKAPSAAASANDAGSAPAVNRRMLMGGMGLTAAAPALPAFAFETFKDTNLGYEFTYPTGLQKSESSQYNIFLRDLIEPLESVGVRVSESKRKSLDEVGDANVVATKLIEDLVPKGAVKEIISAKSVDKNGRRADIIEYAYQWKFDDDSARRFGRRKFQLHNKALVTVDRKKQYLMLVSVEEPRWKIQGDLLASAIDTFKLIFD